MLNTRLIILALAVGLMLPAFAAETGDRGGDRGEGRASCQSFVDADGDGVCDNRAQRRLRHSRLGPRDGSGRGALHRERRAACECQGEEDCECPRLRRGRGARAGEGRGEGQRDGSGQGEAARDGKGRGDGPRDGTGHGPRRGKRTGPQDQSGPGCNE